MFDAPITWPSVRRDRQQDGYFGTVLPAPNGLAAVKPNIVSAARFHDAIVPFRSLLKMASSLDFTMAANCRASYSRRFLLGDVAGDFRHADDLARGAPNGRGGHRDIEQR